MSENPLRKVTLKISDVVLTFTVQSAGAFRLMPPSEEILCLDKFVAVVADEVELVKKECQS